MPNLLDAMRANPGLPVRCRWAEDPADPDARHARGGWGFAGCGPVLATTAEVREAHGAGLLRCVNPWPDGCAGRQRLEWMEFMLARTEDRP